MRTILNYSASEVFDGLRKEHATTHDFVIYSPVQGDDSRISSLELTRMVDVILAVLKGHRTTLVHQRLPIMLVSNVRSRQIETLQSVQEVLISGCK